MRLIICGGRLIDAKQVCRWLEAKFINVLPDARLIIHGGAQGADSGAAMFCRRNGFPELEFKAQWDKYGKSAGSLRNQQMIDEGQADCVLAFPGFRGTADMKDRARRAGLKVYEISLDELESV